jgi:drug/metabolite transporter (DMT)-like permease
VTAPLALLLVSLLWGGTFVAIKEGLHDASPLLFVGLRFLIAAVAAAVVARPSRSSLRRGARVGVALGAVLALAYSAQTLGLVTTTPARSAFLTGLNVGLVPLWAAALLRRAPPRRALIGFVLCVPGLWLLTAPGRLAESPGEAWTLGCAVLFAAHVVLVSRWGAAAGTSSLVVTQLATTAALALAASPLLESPRLAVTPRLAAALLATGLLATAGPLWLQMRFQPRVDPSRAALIYATEPVFAALLAVAWGESLDLRAWSGGALIVAGTLISELGARPWRRGA